MFAMKTVIVVGAGASAEFGLPVGSDLRHEIQKSLDFVSDRPGAVRGDNRLYELISSRQNRADAHVNYLSAAQQIRRALSLVDSIDDYIDTHVDDAAINYCAKAAIARAISQAERRSLLAFDETRGQYNVNWSKIDGTWLTRLFRLFRVGVTKRAPERLFENVSFVSFNYDRTLEHFLMHALRDLFQLSERDAKTIVDGVQIVHPHGTIGVLPWMRKNEEHFVPFGHDLDWAQIHSSTASLRTYSEGATSKEEEDVLTGMVRSADVIVFLGFAYHRSNMARLAVPNSAVKRVFGTALNISDADQAVFRERIERACGGSTGTIYQTLESLECSEFVRQYGNSMMGQ